MSGYNLKVRPCVASIAFLVLAQGFLVISARAAQQELEQLQSAASHLQRGQADQAVGECKAALALNPRSAAAHLLLGQAYLAQRSPGMLAEAKAELQQALDLDPTLLWARFYLARVYIDLGRDDKAKEQLERGLKERPNVPHFLSLLGEVERKLGNPEASIDLNRKALEADPTMTPAHYYEALAYLDLKREDDAIRELESALHSQYVTADMYVALAPLYIKRQRLGEAEDLCRKAIALEASRPEAYLNLARVYNAQRTSDKALAALRVALPDGKTFPASAYYQQLQADAFYEEGLAYQTKGMTAQAIQSYSRALEFDSNRGDTHRQLAGLYFRKGDAIRAQEHASASEKLGSPVDPSLRERIFRSK